MTWPAEAVPDGYVVAPHHLYVGLLVAGIAVWVVADDKPQREPLLVAISTLFALFGFLFVWKWCPGADAAMELAGLTLALLGVLWPGGMWAGYISLRWRLVAFLGVLVAGDDAVSHAFGVWTPLNAGWQDVYHFLP